MREIVEVVVLDQTKSACIAGTYYTKVSYFGEERKVVSTRKYNKGDKIRVKNIGAIADGIRLVQVK